MLDITKAMDAIEQNYKKQFLKDQKKLYDKNFYASLFGIARELFVKRQNSIIINFERANSTSNASSNKGTAGLSKTDEHFISKILKNVYSNDDELYKKLETVDELLEYYQSNLQATDLVLLQVAMEYLSSIYNTSIFNRIVNIMSEYSSLSFQENALFNSMLHYTQRNETLGKPQYIQSLNFIYLLINHLKFFFNNIPIKSLKNFITFDTFYCDESLITKPEIIEELKKLYNIYCKVLNFENILRRDAPYNLQPSQLKIRLKDEFTFEELLSYYNINNFDSDNTNNRKVDIKDPEKFSTRIKEALSKSYDGNQKLLATVLSMPTTSINYYFSPSQKLPKSFPVKIAHALSVTPDYLAGITENPNVFKTEQQTDQQTEQQTDQQTDQQTEQQTDQQTEQQTDQQTEQQTDQQTELLKIFYNFKPSKFDYEYQNSDEYCKLKDSIKSMPEPFQKVTNLLELGKTLEHIIILYTKDNLWRYINGYGCNLNEEKLEKCKKRIDQFKESHKEQYEVMQSSYNELLESFQKIYFDNIERAHATLTKDFLNLENELNEIIYSKKN